MQEGQLKGPVQCGLPVFEACEEVLKDSQEVPAHVRPVLFPAASADGGAVAQHDVSDPGVCGLRLRSLGKLRVRVGVFLCVCQDTADWQRRG